MDTLNPYRPPRILAGLDIGQMTDPTALVLAEREMILGPSGRLEPRFLVRFLERVPLRTAYPEVVRGVRKRLVALGEPVALVVDVTGVGRGPVDLFRDPVSAEVQRAEAALHPTWRLPRALAPIAITLTHGATVHQARWDEWHVPRLTLVMALVVALQQGRVWAPDIPLAHMLIKEAKNFKWDPRQTRDRDEYAAWRENEHDDLLFAASILVWWGEKYAPVLSPEDGAQRYATATGDPRVSRARVR